VQHSFRQYDQHGWRGNVSGQQGTGTASGGAGHNKNSTLPKFDMRGNPIGYREFDVNIRTGAGRDTQRFVIGSDGSIFFTNDHYRSFMQIR